MKSLQQILGTYGELDEPSIILFQYGSFSKTGGEFTTLFNNLSQLGIAVSAGSALTFDGSINIEESAYRGTVVLSSSNSSSYNSKLDYIETIVANPSNSQKHILIKTAFSSYSMDEQVLQLRQMILDISSFTSRKINLVGSSRGGLINVSYAAKYPNTIHKIVSASTPYKLNFTAKMLESSVEILKKVGDHFPDLAEDIKDQIHQIGVDSGMLVGNMEYASLYDHVIGGTTDEMADSDSLLKIQNDFNANKGNTKLYTIAGNTGTSVLSDNVSYPNDAIVSVDSALGLGYTRDDYYVFVSNTPVTLNFDDAFEELFEAITATGLTVYAATRFWLWGAPTFICGLFAAKEINEAVVELSEIGNEYSELLADDYSHMNILDQEDVAEKFAEFLFVKEVN